MTDIVQAHAEAAASAVSKQFQLLPDTVCEASANLNTFFQDLTASLTGVDELGSHAFSGNLAAATLLLVGGALVLAPIIFGRNWLSPVLTMLALFVGGIGSSILLGDPSHGHRGLLLRLWTRMPGFCVWPCVQSGLGKGLASGEVSCGVLLALQLAFAASCAVFVRAHLEVAFFAIGAAGVFFISEVALGLVRDLSTQLPFGVCVWPCVASALGRGISSDFEENAIVGVYALALVGGLTFAYYKEGPLDLVLGLLGASLVATGLMQVLTMDVLSPSMAKTLRIDDLYMVYVAILAVAIEALRYCFLGVIDAAAQIDRTPGASLITKAKALQAKKVAPAAPAAGGKPAKKSMH